jgi:hypothetical protein
MHRFAGLRRLLFAVLAIVNVGASPLAMIGEAQLLAASVAQGLRNHIEDQSHPDCAPVHPDECILCNFLAHVTPERGPAAEHQHVDASIDVSRLERVERVAGAFLPRPRTRAPPMMV